MELEKIETLEFKNELPVKKKEYELIIAEKKDVRAYIKDSI